MESGSSRRTGQPLEDAQATNVWAGKIRPAASASIASDLKIKSIDVQRTAVCVKQDKLHQKRGRPAFFCSPAFPKRRFIDTAEEINQQSARLEFVEIRSP
jgi:hypothetical protein